MKPYLATDLKMMNRQNVYRLLEQKNELSRAEISRITNISMPTVMKIVAHFLETGIVTEAGDGVTAMGRKPQMLRFEPSAYYSVGVEYEGDYLRAGMVDLRGGIALVLQERVMGRFREVMTHQLLSLVEKVIAQSGVERSRIAGVGMGVPAIVDVEKVTVSAAPAVGILEDIDCKPILAGLSERLKLPMYLENDTNAAALGEYALAASSAPVISLSEGLEGLPEGLLDCACFCVQLQAGFSAYELTSVEITQLELAAEFDGPDGGTLCLYKLGSRGKLADADAMPAGGVQIADGWFNDGLLYMLLRRDGEDFSYIGVMHELTLDEMGGDYEAAALDLYGRVLAGGVTWSSNLAMSSLNAIQCRFEFNYNALDMRFSASCSEGQLESSGHTLIWTPEPDTAFAVVSFTLRDASGESVSGSIVITRIARSSEASSTYLASLACPGYVMEPLANGTGATIRAAE